MAKPLDSGETLVLSSKGELNALHSEICKDRSSVIKNAIAAGVILRGWKAKLPRGEYTTYVEQHFNGSERTARDYSKAAETYANMTASQRKSFLHEECSLTALLTPPKGKKTAESAAKELNTSTVSDASTDSSGGEAGSLTNGPPASDTGKGGELGNSSGLSAEGICTPPSSPASNDRPQVSSSLAYRGGGGGTDAAEAPAAVAECPHGGQHDMSDGEACSKCSEPVEDVPPIPETPGALAWLVWAPKGDENDYYVFSEERDASDKQQDFAESGWDCPVVPLNPSAPASASFQSQFLALWDSCNDSQELWFWLWVDEHKPKPKAKCFPAHAIPASLYCDEFLSAWAMWEEHRCDMQPKPTKKAIEQQLKKLSGWGVSRAVSAITHSVANSYKGIFEDTQNGSPSTDKKGRAAMEYIE